MTENLSPVPAPAPYRYPGAQPFDSEQSDVFYGREKEIESLSRHIMANPVVVLYSKSGYGKSSLLKAGILPAFENTTDFKPILVRFKTHEAESKETPIYTTRKNVVKGIFEKTWLDHLINNEPSLWHDVKEQQIVNQGKLSLLLVFDQFEELFDYPPAQILEFKSQLGELLYSQVPQRYRDALHNHENAITPEQRVTLFEAPRIHVVFSIREDRMHLLLEISDHIQHILKKPFELLPLGITGAEDAIYNPAQKKSNKFISPVFEYHPNAIQKIIAFLTQNNKPIESFELQVICNAIEREVISKGLTKIDADKLGDLGGKIENYYYDQLDTIKDEEDKKKARILLENGLISEIGQRRRSLRLPDITAEFGVTSALLTKLVDSHLIRAERLPDDTYAYELSHDSLIEPIIKAKLQRVQKEREKQLAKEARDARRRQWILGGLSVIVGLLFALTLVMYKRSQAHLLLAEEAIRSKSDEHILAMNYDKVTNILHDLVAIGATSNKTKETIFEMCFYLVNARPNDSIPYPVRLEKAFSQLSAIYEQPRIFAQFQAIKQDDMRLSALLSGLDSVLYKNMADKYLVKMIPVEGLAFSKTEVTVWQYHLFCQNTGRNIIETASNWGLIGDFPVVKVDWYDAIEYANWLSKKHGFDTVYAIDKSRQIIKKADENYKFDYLDKNSWIVSLDSSKNGFRLPTAKEWRFAASYRQDSSWVYAGSNDFNKVAWFAENSRANNVYEPNTVAQKDPNFAGLYDLSGNVWEWCQDNPTKADCCSGQPCKMIIGGAFNSVEEEPRSIKLEECGYTYHPDRTWFNAIGIRLCRTLK